MVTATLWASMEERNRKITSYRKLSRLFCFIKETVASRALTRTPDEGVDIDERYQKKPLYSVAEIHVYLRGILSREVLQHHNTLDIDGNRDHSAIFTVEHRSHKAAGSHSVTGPELPQPCALQNLRRNSGVTTPRDYETNINVNGDNEGAVPAVTVS
ncbi:hypothetical protein EJ05DRAFT_539691 [Pseudovirgaria hyperparasitica]|uniref:Uncharacterized protein n=1 Tax=Pseudovirgaria hyperparasitica TaxID=470096 RepID=A0A6A6W460_9PEZI|nr:uncharacterized protein EJ05DRAFT_539691 [Pseudovirgaria hyperparasitica]KAF2755831.1 hypothetical protein EJ05DRAFT_539691 [Pseudovirgaria hyperparasitica]